MTINGRDKLGVVNGGAIYMSNKVRIVVKKIYAARKCSGPSGFFFKPFLK